MLWNKDSAYRGPGSVRMGLRGRYVKPNGEVILTSVLNMATHYPFADPRSKSDTIYQYRNEWTGPTRIAGMITVLADGTKDLQRRALTYQPSTRRVRLAPDYAADTPVSAAGGSWVYDDDGLFAGKRDRYDWKLIGKKEVYLPYNNYRLSYPAPNGGCTEKDAFVANHPKPECIRWELHRVWHVQATLKDGRRHVYHKRDYFFDEDIQSVGIAENYDQAGKLWRMNMIASVPAYEALAPGYGEQITLDLQTGIYFGVSIGTGIRIQPFDENLLNSANMTTQVIK
ncbi:DUF1329 domain-containing protein [Massilia cavernae]|uniref:DUF1329 domain-containing protein n=1 Tax=Massilia cavernae TaxID=2320864 RepID=A0A418Y6D0_9BURK|nr:DUF1329 domain-containing protein [Massilia cavernae]